MVEKKRNLWRWSLWKALTPTLRNKFLWELRNWTNSHKFQWSNQSNSCANPSISLSSIKAPTSSRGLMKHWSQNPWNFNQIRTERLSSSSWTWLLNLYCPSSWPIILEMWKEWIVIRLSSETVLQQQGLKSWPTNLWIGFTMVNLWTAEIWRSTWQSPPINSPCLTSMSLPMETGCCTVILRWRVWEPSLLAISRKGSLTWLCTYEIRILSWEESLSSRM